MLEKDIVWDGYPSEKGQQWYGLWNPNHDCFIWVSEDLEHLELLQMLLSTKVLVQIVVLSAFLHESNLIDNTCCHNWTVKDVQIGFNEVYKNYDSIQACEVMLKDRADDVQEIRDWVAFICKWIRILKTDSNRFDSFLSRVIDFQTESNIPKLYRILLMSDDINKADALLNQHFNAVNGQ
jgi:hypothetical protein